MKTSYLKIRLLLGCISLIEGLLAANLAFFGWQDPHGSFYLLGEYAHYVCAYVGFAAMILGSMLINDFFVLRTSIDKNYKTRRNATTWLIRARAEWQLARDFGKYCSMEPKLIQYDFFLDTEEELEVFSQ